MVEDRLIRAPGEVQDGFQSLTSGVDSGRSPAVLDRSQLSWLINGTTRGNFAQCRPGWFKRTLTFKNSEGSVDTTVRDNFKTGGRWQGASGYVNDKGVASLVASIGGRLFQIDINSFNTQDLTTQAGYTNNPESPLSWFCQAENILIHQNGQETADIFNGATLRKSTFPQGGQEVPNGTCMAYNNGRLWVADTSGYAFVAGDLAYTGGDRQYFLNFTDNEFLNGGGSFMVPANAGRIRAMQSIAVQDSTTGQGPLQVFTTRGVFSVNAPFDRTQWQNTTNPIQTVSLLSSGAVAQFSTVNVNGDLWFRSPDGIRSFIIARRDHGTWVNTPLSREVERALNYDSAGFLDHASGVLFDNRLLMTTQPMLKRDGSDTRGIIHKGLVVLDFAPTTQMFNRSQPVWEGVWTGLNILQILTVDIEPQRCFMFVLNADNEIELWELSKNNRFDSTDSRIEWVIETPEYGFADGGWELKELRYGDIWLNRMAGEVSFVAKFREDSYPIWRTWDDWDECAKYRDCDMASCDTPTQYREQFKTRKRLPTPSQVCNEENNKPSTHGYRFAARIEITGFCRIPQFRIHALRLPEYSSGGECSTSSECTDGYAGCPDDDYDYETEE